MLASFHTYIHTNIHACIHTHTYTHTYINAFVDRIHIVSNALPYSFNALARGEPFRISRVSAEDVAPESPENQCFRLPPCQLTPPLPGTPANTTLHPYPT